MIADTIGCRRLALALAATLLAAGCAPTMPLATKIDAERLRLATAAETAGDPGGALAFLSVAAAKDRDPAVQMRYAAALANAGRGAEAIRVAERVRAAHTDDRALARQVGRLCVRLRDGAAAARAFQAILRRTPDDAEALDGLGLSYALQGRLLAARDSFAFAVQEDPANLPARNNLALSYVLAGDAPKAINLLESAERGEGAPRRLRHTLALAYAAAGNAARAQALLEPELGATAASEAVASYIRLSASGPGASEALAPVEIWNSSTPSGQVAAKIARGPSSQ